MLLGVTTDLPKAFRMGVDSFTTIENAKATSKNQTMALLRLYPETKAVRNIIHIFTFRDIIHSVSHVYI